MENITNLGDEMTEEPITFGEIMNLMVSVGDQPYQPITQVIQGFEVRSVEISAGSLLEMRIAEMFPEIQLSAESEDDRPDWRSEGF